jgi:hypothetical protein
VDLAYLHRTDYVRIKIASRDVRKIPEIAEGAILPYLYDFQFEREVEIGGTEPEITVQVLNMKDGDHPSPKRANTGDQGNVQTQRQLQLEAPQKGKTDTQKMKEVVEEFAHAYAGSSSAPPKVMEKDTSNKPVKLMTDAQMFFVRPEDIRKDDVCLYNCNDDSAGAIW